MELDELKEAVAVPLKHKEPGPVVGTDVVTFMTTPASVGTDEVFNKRLENGEDRFLKEIVFFPDFSEVRRKGGR